MEQCKRRTDFFFYVWLFFLLSCFGWLWEGFLYLFKDDMYVNRGFLTGPWLPIYGVRRHAGTSASQMAGQAAADIRIFDDRVYGAGVSGRMVLRIDLESQMVGLQCPAL